MPKFKGYKASAVLVIMMLCCLAFGGVAVAGGSDSELSPNVVKASHTYSYNFEFDVDIEAIVLGDTDLVVQFPAVASGTQFDLSPAAGHAVEVGMGVTKSGYQYMQIVPTIDNANQKATFRVQKQNLPMTGNVKYIKIQGLKVKSTCVPDTYTVCVSSSTNCFPTICKGLRVVETVGSVTITSPVPGTIQAGGTTVTVEGTVTDACGNPWPYDTWPVIISVVDSKGLPAIDPTSGAVVCEDQLVAAASDSLYIPNYCCTDPCSGNFICPVIAHTVRNPGGATTFSEAIKVPACWQYGQDYFIKARTVEVKDANADPEIEYVGSFTTTPDLVPAEGLEDGKSPHIAKGSYHVDGCLETAPHAWLAASDVVITSGPGVAVAIKQMAPPNEYTNSSAEDIEGISDDGEIPFNKPVPVKVQVIDKFCHSTTVDAALKVDLAAYFKSGGGKDIAGNFYDKIKTDGGVEISHVYVPAGQSSVTVYFYANAASINKQIYVEERSIIGGTPQVAQCRAIVRETDKVYLEIDPKVVCNESPRAGWPLSAAVWVDPRATEDFDVKVELYDPSSTSQFPCNFAEWATWDTTLNVCFNAKGQFEGHGDVYDEDGDALICEACHGWATYVHPWSTNKSHFYIYVDKNAVGKTLQAQVTLKGKVTGHILKSELITVGPFISPVELTRALDAESWQTLSTPKYLANGTDCTKYGTFADLMPAGSYRLIVSYENGSWKVKTGADVVEPLKCYYVKTEQRKEPGPDADYWTAKYIYARADDPSESMPPMRTLGLGWNSVGVSVQYDCSNTFAQADPAYHFLGSICNGCKLVYNPGSSLGNLAPWTVLAVSQGTMPAWMNDPNYPVFNGDNYWVYLNQTQDLAANIGLELVDP
ncbi:MAG: hypothetical protein HPY50_11780 [Firmicutes bacterium]|nr:hypothetical protein [Bacillota bacterium]